MITLHRKVSRGEAISSAAENIYRRGLRASRHCPVEGDGRTESFSGVLDVRKARPRGYSAYATPPPPNWSGKHYLWGIEIAGAVVSVGAGAAVVIGGVYQEDPVVESAAANVTITADNQFIAWKYTISSNTLVVDTTPTTDKPKSSSTIKRGVLYKVRWDAVNSKITGIIPWQFGVVQVIITATAHTLEHAT